MGCKNTQLVQNSACDQPSEALRTSECPTRGGATCPIRAKSRRQCAISKSRRKCAIAFKTRTHTHLCSRRMNRSAPERLVSKELRKHTFPCSERYLVVRAAHTGDWLSTSENRTCSDPTPSRFGIDKSGSGGNAQTAEMPGWPLRNRFGGLSNLVGKAVSEHLILNSECTQARLTIRLLS